MSTKIICRKINLIPVESYRTEWKRKVIQYLTEQYEKQQEILNEYQEKLKSSKSSDKKIIEGKIEVKKRLIERINAELELNPDESFSNQTVKDYTYQLIRNAMESEACRKNYILSWFFSQMTLGDLESLKTQKEVNDYLNDLLNPAFRKKGSKKGSLFDKTNITNILNGYGVAFSNSFKKLVKNLYYNGVLNGKITMPTYKIDSPFTISKSDMGFRHNSNTIEDLKEDLRKNNYELYFAYGSNSEPTIANFKINIGTKSKNKDEIKSTLYKLYSGEYQFCGSKIGIENGKIFLYLSIETPETKRVLDENTVVGVDMGQKIPAMCALNNNDYIRKSIGSEKDFLRVRTKIRNQIKDLQMNLSMTNGGHGRKKKLKTLERFRDYERNFVSTYNHKVSKAVVDFALKNNAKYINIECLKGYNVSKKILSTWSYYQLQEYITYKAARYGIEVRKINPCFTSQVCSYCGHWEKGQRIKQEQFICKSDECKSKSILEKTKHTYINADFNAARNIAKSTLFFDGEVGQKQIEEAAKYYNIPYIEE